MDKLDDLIFLVKKYIVFLSYFMYMYPLKKNNKTLVNSLDRCKCGNSQRMLTYLLNFDTDNQVRINNKKELDKIESISKYIFNKVVEADAQNKHLLIKIHLGIIDHTFVMDIYKGNVYIYQSYIDINPLIITKLKSSHVKDLFDMLDKMATMSTDLNKVHIDNYMMESMSRIFGVPSSKIKFEFDDNVIFGTKILDPIEFYDKMTDICWLYYEKFVKIGKLVTFEYLDPKNKNKYKKTDDALVEEFDGDMMYNEFTHLIHELQKLTNSDRMTNLCELVDKDNVALVVKDQNILSSGWLIAKDFVKDEQSINIVNEAIKLGVLDKMDPSTVLNNNLLAEFNKVKSSSADTMSGGKFKENNKNINYNKMYFEYKQKYKSLN